jgi:hypothetical protein
MGKDKRYLKQRCAECYVIDPAEPTDGCSDLGTTWRKSNCGLEADKHKSSEASIIHSFMQDEWRDTE